MTKASSKYLFPGVLAVVLVAFLFGGGGSRFGLANLAVQLAAFTALAAFPGPVLEFWRRAPILLRAAIAASLLLPLVQLVPLPAGVWTALPGRELVKRSLEAAVLEDAWMPLSTYPLRTALALSALVTPLAVVMLGWSLPRHHLLNLGWAVVGMGLATFVIGVLQVYAGLLTNLWPEGIDFKVLLGTFANRNSTGLFLLSGIALAICLPAPRPHPAEIPVRLMLSALLLTAVILTKSRTAFVLALIPLMLGLLNIAAGLARQTGTRIKSQAWIIPVAVVALGTLGIAATVIMAPGRVSETLERFDDFGDDSRKYIWEDASYVASRYWPVGAGMGTFDDVFQIDEALENLGARRAGRAHNDYLEVTIEAGLPGLVLVAGWFVVIAMLGWQARHSQDRWTAWAAASFLLAVALQSITDYPLRNQTILATSAVALLLLARLATDRRERSA